MFASYEFVAVLENDLLVSPAIHAYFSWAADVLAAQDDEDDDALLAASAWNDNGFEHTAMHVLRGNHFMGLGWLMAARTWRRRVEPTWREQRTQYGWDTILQSLFATKKKKKEDASSTSSLACLFPAVPLSHHIGTASGLTTSSKAQKTFDAMVLYAGSAAELRAVLPAPSVMTLASSYDAYYLSQTVNARIVLCAAELRSSIDWNRDVQRELLCGHPIVALGFGRIMRGVHKGSALIMCAERRVWIVAVYSPFRQRAEVQQQLQQQQQQQQQQLQ
jgi:hypothetical protein